MISRQDVLEAADRIRGHVRRTPSIEVDHDGARLLLKCEQLQVTGVFKARGAFNRILSARERGELDPRVGVVAASGGNAGLSHAFAAAAVGVPATVYVPTTAPATKVARLRGYGATVVAAGSEYAEAHDAATVFSRQRGALFCHAYDQPEVVAGAGTMAEEMLDDDPDIDTIVLAAGGGGLYAGVAAAVRDRARVVVVEPRACAALNAALRAGRPVDVPVSGVAADSLGARRVGDLAFAAARATDPVSVLVDDPAIEAARHRLWADYRIVAEHGAATALAALDAGAYVPGPGERVAVVVCGANTDLTTLAAPPAG